MVRLLLDVQPGRIVAHLDEKRAVQKLVEVVFRKKVHLRLPGEVEGARRR